MELPQKKKLSCEAVKVILEAAEKKAKENGWNVCIAIVDDAGRLMAFIRMDSTTNASVDVAIAKAVHAANYARDTKFHQDLLEKGNPVVATLPNSLPLAGGVRLLLNGELLGAIGVSGVASEDDDKIARAGADVVNSFR
jgi:uncharacterized protein GlcG (DUF336 family)